MPEFFSRSPIFVFIVIIILKIHDDRVLNNLQHQYVSLHWSIRRFSQKTDIDKVCQMQMISKLFLFIFFIGRLFYYGFILF